MFSADRKITYIKYDIASNWAAHLPVKNWLMLIYEENAEWNQIDEVLRKAIDRNVCYICATGERAEKIHDLCDEETVYRDAENSGLPNSYHLPEFFIMTTWHEGVNEGIEYAIHFAYHDEIQIEEIVCLDMSKSDFLKIKLNELSKKKYKYH